MLENDQKNIRIALENCFLLDSFLTTVKYDGMFNKTLIPVEHENIEAKFGSIRRFRYSNRNGNNDFESIKDTNMFIMEHGVRTKTFPLEILNDNLYEKESIVNLAIKKTVGFCVLMPCLANVSTTQLPPRHCPRGASRIE